MTISIQVGDSVRVKASVDYPSFGWGAVTPQCIGKVTRIDIQDIVVNFPRQNFWYVKPDELEVINTGAEDYSTVNTRDE